MDSKDLTKVQKDREENLKFLEKKVLIIQINLKRKII